MNHKPKSKNYNYRALYKDSIKPIRLIKIRQNMFVQQRILSRM